MADIQSTHSNERQIPVGITQQFLALSPSDQESLIERILRLSVEEGIIDGGRAAAVLAIGDKVARYNEARAIHLLRVNERSLQRELEAGTICTYQANTIRREASALERARMLDEFSGFNVMVEDASKQCPILTDHSVLEKYLSDYKRDIRRWLADPKPSRTIRQRLRAASNLAEWCSIVDEHLAETKGHQRHGLPGIPALAALLALEAGKKSPSAVAGAIRAGAALDALHHLSALREKGYQDFDQFTNLIERQEFLVRLVWQSGVGSIEELLFSYSTPAGLQVPASSALPRNDMTKNEAYEFVMQNYSGGGREIKLALALIISELRGFAPHAGICELHSNPKVLRYVIDASGPSARCRESLLEISLDLSLGQSNVDIELRAYAFITTDGRIEKQLHFRKSHLGPSELEDAVKEMLKQEKSRYYWTVWEADPSAFPEKEWALFRSFEHSLLGSPHGFTRVREPSEEVLFEICRGGCHSQQASFSVQFTKQGKVVLESRSHVDGSPNVSRIIFEENGVMIRNGDEEERLLLARIEEVPYFLFDFFEKGADDLPVIYLQIQKETAKRHKGKLPAPLVLVADKRLNKIEMRRETVFICNPNREIE